MSAHLQAGGALLCAGCAERLLVLTEWCPDCGSAPLLDGRYALLEVLGRGRAGITYKARCLTTGELVAVKELPLRAGDPAKRRELFEREAAILRQLHHPAIPRFIEDFEAGRGKSRGLYLVREYVEGRDLRSEMDRHRYTPAEVLDIVDELLGVLAYLHGLSPPVIHRDIKPANVLRRFSDRRLVLVDFGAVRDAIQDDDLGGSTVAGTFGYMAPEQFRGDALAATDLYGLGALAVCLLTRREPHTLLTPSGKLDWVRHTRVEPTVTLLVNALLEADPLRRPRSAMHARSWLHAARRGAHDRRLPPIPTALAPVEVYATPRPAPASTALVTTTSDLPDAVPFVGMAIGMAAGLSLLAMMLAMLMTVLGLVLI